MSKVHTVDPKILCATAPKFVATVTWRPEFVHFCHVPTTFTKFRESLHLFPSTFFRLRFCMHFSSITCVLHVLPIIYFLIHNPNSNWCRVLFTEPLIMQLLQCSYSLYFLHSSYDRPRNCNHAVNLLESCSTLYTETSLISNGLQV